MAKSKIAELEGKVVPIIVDLGYLTRGSAIDTSARADALIAAGLGKRHFQVTGFHRLMVELPPKKAAAIIKEFPIVEGETYFRATHHWRGLKKGERKARPIVKSKGKK